MILVLAQRLKKRYYNNHKPHSFRICYREDLLKPIIYESLAFKVQRKSYDTHPKSSRHLPTTAKVFPPTTNYPQRTQMSRHPIPKRL
ncbi:hypothetical protein CEXT_512171 [Caerostris extrusa]|uniref:Uncharacterized protein n=1 Tax=Caerostris extrusa TaxID=172846 RepID=A0AAV4M7S0_CAEEX|nr:hypothetical protein CEXT_512171 [Caerostris extrusa]